MLFSSRLRPDKTAVIEAIMSIFLSFYVEATLYDFQQNLKAGGEKASLGVGLYIISFLLALFFVEYGVSKNTKTHSIIRKLLFFSVIIMCAVNVLLANEVNGAKNWIEIAGFSFQPGEIIKILYLFYMLVPDNKKYMNKKNLIPTLVITTIAMGYSVIIRDIGLLLLLSVIFATASIIQSESILYIIGVFIIAIVGAFGVLKVSLTALVRVQGWLGESKNVLDSLTGSGVFADSFNRGYQQTRSWMAIRNGGLFGSTYDALSGLEAFNNDLVIAFIAQRHGFVSVILILFLFAVLIVNTFVLLRQQTKLQQRLSCMALSLIMAAFILNFCGSLGIIPLTGVVSPALSQGVTAAIPYGACFGLLSSSGLTKEYIDIIKKKPQTEDE